jgi:hypothetical protein
MYNTTGLKHLKLVEEVFVESTRTHAAAKKFRSFTGIDPQDEFGRYPGLLTILQKTFGKANKDRTWTVVIYWVRKLYAWLYLYVGMKYSTRDGTLPLAVFDRQHIVVSGDFIPTELLGRDIFKALLERHGSRRRRWKHLLMDELGNKMNADGNQDSSAVYSYTVGYCLENIK